MSVLMVVAVLGVAVVLLLPPLRSSRPATESVAPIVIRRTKVRCTSLLLDDDDEEELLLCDDEVLLCDDEVLLCDDDPLLCAGPPVP